MYLLDIVQVKTEPRKWSSSGTKSIANTKRQEPKKSTASHRLAECAKTPATSEPNKGKALHTLMARGQGTHYPLAQGDQGSLVIINNRKWMDGWVDMVLMITNISQAHGNVPTSTEKKNQLGRKQKGIRADRLTGERTTYICTRSNFGLRKILPKRKPLVSPVYVGDVGIFMSSTIRVPRGASVLIRPSETHEELGMYILGLGNEGGEITRRPFPPA
ncbi:hypothetical protein FA15DRAFT_657399 [Coprinopsis marcescibilis]|uniref:Uncharacterized protein n=1 Tax=Coprinopsis marcescibilis TaxID=230819 RepID=A0A5C3KQI2_COPMA|nr:hypothetical protein FA15DRAFT_657399 [Coprinopsis marcescibilis]